MSINRYTGNDQYGARLEPYEKGEYLEVRDILVRLVQARATSLESSNKWETLYNLILKLEKELG